jgi:hypothetical protein
MEEKSKLPLIVKILIIILLGGFFIVFAYITDGEALTLIDIDFDFFKNRKKKNDEEQDEIADVPYDYESEMTDGTEN